MINKAEITRSIIYDKPSETDAFSGGGHTRTARSLAKLIKTFDDETRAIGLEGRWGSGKSSVVEMAKKMLEAGELEGADTPRKYHIFTYDLWAHQTAGFRRTFLEQLIAWLKAQPSSDISKLDKIHDQITNRSINTRTTNRKTFSLYGLVVLLFVLCLPLIYMWLSPAALTSHRAASHWLSASAKITVAGMLVISILHIGATWWRSRNYMSPLSFVRRWWQGKKTTDAQLSLLDAASRAMSPFSKDADITTIDQRIREVDPSQHQFEETFKDILATYQTSHRRIIIVFDNIDRLPSEKIKDAWSDTRAMVSSERPSDGVERKITIIIPYDREHILNAVKADSDDEQVQEDLLRKSFDAVLYVAAPVIADVTKFFEAKMRAALGADLHEDDIYRVGKIFEISCKGSLATPRRIISFINSVAGVWDEWEGKMPLPAIAVYITHREKISRDPGILRKPDEIDPRQRDLGDDGGLFRNLAALAYNVEPEYAFQILLHAPMQELFTSDADESQLLDITGSPAWDAILPEIYRDNAPDWARQSVMLYRNAVRNLCNLKATSSQKLESKRALLGEVENLLTVTPNEWDAYLDLIRLIEICNEPEANRWVNGLSAWMYRGLPEVSRRGLDDGRQWIAFVGPTFDALEKRFNRETAAKILSSISFPEGDEFLVGVAYDTDTVKFHLRELKNITASAELQTALGDRIALKPGEFRWAWPELRHLVPNQAAHVLLQSLCEHLQTTSVGNASESGHLMRSFNMLSSEVTSDDPLNKLRRNLVTTGVFYHHVIVLQKVGAGKNEDALVEVLWAILDQTKGTLPPLHDFSNHAFGDLNPGRDWIYSVVNSGSSSQGILDGLAAILRRYERIAEFVGWCANNEAPILGQVLAVFSNGADLASLPVAVVAKHYRYLQGALGQKLGPFLDKIEEQRPIEDWSDLDPIATPIGFVADNAAKLGPKWGAMYANIDSWLATQDGDALEKALVEESHLLHLLQLRSAQGLSLSPENLKPAIRRHLLIMVAGEHETAANFDAVCDALPANTRTGLSLDILDHLDRSIVTSAGLENVLQAYPRLMEQLPLARRPDVVGRKIILPLVEASLTGSTIALNFLETHKRSIRQTIRKVEDPSVIGEIADYLSEGNKKKDKEAQAIRAKIAGILGMAKSTRSSKSTGSDVAIEQDAGD